MNQPLEEYHHQRDALLGKTADHLNPPDTYSRGVVPKPDKRSKRRRSLLIFVFHALLTLLLFGLFALVFFFGLTGKE